MIAALVFVALSLYLFAYEVLFGGYDRWMLVVGAAGVSFSWLAKWAEMRWRNTLAYATLRVGEETLALMQDVASGNVDPDEAREAIAETQDRIEAFRREFDTMLPRQ